MTPCPLIVTHHCPDCPKAGHEWIAAFYVDAYSGTKKAGTWRVTGLSRLPMPFFGATEADARSAAERWWAEEQEREARREAAIAARIEGARKARNAA
jgi:hypothetical protein